MKECIKKVFNFLSSKEATAIERIVMVLTLIVLVVQSCILRNQANIQTKTVMVDNLIRLNQQIYPCERINKIIEATENNKPILKENGGDFTKVELDNFLGYFEMIGIIEKMGYLNREIIYDMFSADIENIFANKEIQQYLQLEKERGYKWPFLNRIRENIQKYKEWKKNQ